MTNEEISHRTKQALAEALKETMAYKPFDKITVAELIRRCNISRPTFYYHFETIYELMEWMFENETLSLLEKSEDCFTWDQGILLMLRYIYENHALCACAYHSVGRELLKRMFYQHTETILRRFVQGLNESIHAKPEHIDFIVRFYVQAYAASLISWLEEGLTQSPEEMLELYRITVYGNIKRALERSAEGE